jgi:uncharacterized protein YndB with AHSA1/START domain
MAETHSGTPRTTTAPPDAPQLVVTRRIAAPPERVFDAWLDPERLRVWMAPGHMPGSTARVAVDPRVGGAFRIDMVGGDGRVFEHVGTYLELDRPRRLCFTWISEGTEQRASVVRVELTPVDGGTELRLTHTGLPSEESARGHEEGWGELVDQLSTLLAPAA